MRGILGFLLFLGVVLMALYLFVWTIYPPCDVIAREKVIDRYVSKVNNLNLETTNSSTKNWEAYMEASLTMQKELVACHCGPPQSGAEATARMWRKELDRFVK